MIDGMERQDRSEIPECGMGADPEPIKAPRDEEELEERLSRPTPGVIAALSGLEGDVMILGVGGKIGPSLARMARRGLDACGSSARVIGAARFSNGTLEDELHAQGIETLRVDLMDREAVRALPQVPNIIYMAGFKFGATQRPERTWAMNVLTPAIVAEHFTNSRLLCYSTGCVYPNVPVVTGGSREEDTLEPLGEYANSCVGRERMFGWFAHQNGTPLTVFRLNYAVDLRYGVLVDIAQKVMAGEPVDVTMGYVNVVWQGDANALALQSLAAASCPPLVINATGPETVSVRSVAERFGQAFGIPARIEGQEADEALLSNSGKACAMFGYPSVALDTLVDWVAQWMTEGGRTLNKPTHFEVRDGRY